MIILKKKPESILALAKLLKKDFKNAHAEVTFLVYNDVQKKCYLIS